MASSESRLTKFALVVCIIAVLAAFGLNHIGIANLGLPIGYYEHHNRVLARLKRIPGVTIRGVRENHDISLEDFTFDLTVDGKYDISLFFHEPPSPSWELFDAADLVMIQCERVGSSSHSPDIDRFHWWALPLPTDNVAERALGANMRNATDVLANFGRIVAYFQEKDRTKLDQQNAYLSGAHPKKILEMYFDLPTPTPSSTP